MGQVDDSSPADPSEPSHDPRPTPPLVALARRHRRTIGIAVAAVMVAVLAWSVLSPPEASAPGFFGVVQQYTFPLICALIAAVALAWGLKARTLVVNLLAYATIAAYLIYLVTGWVYENFVVS